MSIITKKEIQDLSDVKGTPCVSIFIPTHRAGQEVLEGKDAILLKNQLQEVSNQLEEQGLNPKEISDLLGPVENLLDDVNFWRHQSDGLAIFLANGFFQKYTLPIRFEAYNYVSNEFYLKPLMPMLVGDGRFFILTLELENVNFFEGSRHSITDVHIDDLTPSRLEERVGFDYQSKFLQFRSQQAGNGQAYFHGHGAGKEDQKKEILQYFRAINDGLMTMLHDEYPPMIVACLDHYFPLYQEVNTYKHLMDLNISMNPADMDALLLHEKAWNIVKTRFDEERKEQIDIFKEYQDTQKTSSEIEEIIPAALDGKIQTLFVENRADIWGVYNPAKREVNIEETHDAPNVSLLNLVATKTMLKGGKVHLLEKEEMPNPHAKVNAVYRY